MNKEKKNHHNAYREYLIWRYYGVCNGYDFNTRNELLEELKNESHFKNTSEYEIRRVV